MADYEPIIDLMKKLDIPITRQNFIDVNWFGDPPEEWDVEAENQIPPELQNWSWLKIDTSDAWEKSEHPRGQPENAGQFASVGSGGSTAARTTSAKGKRPKPSNKAHAEVKKIADPVGYYDELYTEASNKFQDAGFDLRIDSSGGGRWTPNTLGLYDNNGKRADLTEMKPSLKKLWKDLNEANSEAAQGRSIVLTTGEADKVTKIVSDELGYDHTQVSYSDEDRKFTLNDVEYTTGGLAYLDTGKITMFPKFIKSSGYAGVLAHEIMHQKWEAVYNQYKKEREAVMEKTYQQSKAKPPIPRKDWVLSPTDQVRPQYVKDYPVYAALGSLDIPELQKDDGITDYSRNHWAAYEKGENHIETAIHETLAEMSMLDWEGTLPRLLWYKESKTWKPLYDAIKEVYPKLKPQDEELLKRFGEIQGRGER